jgi:glycosyltransferase involved in cell wall biosynthesis/phosphatidylglycerophosphate synthase
MKLTILWDRLAGYSTAFFRELVRQGCEIQLVYVAAAGDLKFQPFDLGFCRQAIEVREDFPQDLAGRVIAFQPACVLMSGWKFDAYMQTARLMKKRGVPVIAAMDNPWRGDLRQRLASWLSPWLLQPAIDAIYAAGERQLQFAAKLRFTEAFSGLYSAEVGLFQDLRPLRERPPAFLFVGRLIERKGVDQLLTAYSQYRNSVTNPMPLIVAGSGGLEQHCRDTPGVELRGFVQPASLPRLFERAHCLVLPSRTEHWGVVLHEAAAAGLPLIASSACCATVNFLRDGANGYLVHAEAAAIRDALVRFHALQVEAREHMSDISRGLAQSWTPGLQARHFVAKAHDLIQRLKTRAAGGLTLADFRSLRFSMGGHAMTRVVSQRIGAVIAWLGLRLGLSPNAITILGTGVFILGTAMFAKLPRGWEYSLACLAMLQLGYGVDCADGQLARATGRSSQFGAWLDIACDFFRNVLIGSAVAMWLVFCRLQFSLCMFIGGLFIAGTAVQLHTVTILRQTHGKERLHTHGFTSNVRALVTASMDTATVLLCLALLREFPRLLAVYAGGIGALNLLSSLYLASRRLRAE